MGRLVSRRAAVVRKGLFGALILALETVFGLATPSTFAATKRLKVDAGACSYVARYDPRQFDQTALRTTLNFLYDDTPALEFGPSLWTPKAAATADIVVYKSACVARERKFLDLKLLDNPDVIELRRQKIAELRQSCEETVATLQAAKGDVARLRTFAPAVPHCEAYVGGLEKTGGAFEAYWRRFLRDYCVRTQPDRPDCVKKAFDADKPDVMQRKRLFVLNFGWHNCANAHLLHNEGFDGVHEAGSNRLRKQIVDRLTTLLKIKASCEGPD